MLVSNLNYKIKNKNLKLDDTNVAGIYESHAHVILAIWKESEKPDSESIIN